MIAHKDLNIQTQTSGHRNESKLPVCYFKKMSLYWGSIRLKLSEIINTKNK